MVTAAALAVVAASAGCTSRRVGVVVEGVAADMADMEVMGMEDTEDMGEGMEEEVMEEEGAMEGEVMEGEVMEGVMEDIVIVHMEGMGDMDMQGMGHMGHLEDMGDLEDTVDLEGMGEFLPMQLFCGTKMAGHYPPFTFHQDKGIEVGAVA